MDDGHINDIFVPGSAQAQHSHASHHQEDYLAIDQALRHRTIHGNNVGLVL